MVKTWLIFVVVAVAVGCITGAVLTSGTNPAVSSCKNSYDCGSGHCCRDSSTGKVLSSQQFGGGFGFGPPSPNTVGMCTTKKAQMGEACDTDCQCDPGMTCYRPVSGVCCPPMTCHNSTWVQHQRDYWRKCMADPHCGLPP